MPTPHSLADVGQSDRRGPSAEPVKRLLGTGWMQCVWAFSLAVSLLAGCGPPSSGPPLPASDPPTEVPAEAVGTSEWASFRIREWTVDDGLQGQAFAVTQTADGYLWITTEDGLVRFDGDRFVTFTTETTPEFRSNDFLGVYAAASGDLWVGDRDGWVYRYRDQGWTAYDVEELLDNHWVQGFAEDAEGTVWMVSTGFPIARFEDEQWTRLPQRLYIPWPTFAADGRGTLWALLDSTEAPGVPVSAIKPGVVARWDGSRFVPGEPWQQFGFIDTQYGPLFHRPVGTAADLAREGRLEIEVAEADGTVRGSFDYTGGPPTTTRLVDRSGRLWVQTEGAGAADVITVYDDGEEVLRVAPPGATYVEQVFEDRQGSVWLFSSSTGLIQVSEEPFRRFSSDEEAPLFATRASLGAGGTVWISGEGELNNGTQIVTPRAGSLQVERYRALASAPAELVQDGLVEIGNVTEDARGRRYGGSGEYLFGLRDGQAELVWQDPRGATVWSIEPDPRLPDVLWLGTTTGFVWHVDTRSGAVLDSFRVSDDRVNQLHARPDGRLWIAIGDGLQVRDPDGRVRVMEDTALDGVSARDLLFRPNGDIWVATSRGLIRVRGDQVTALGTAHGLPPDVLTMVLADDLGFVWLSGRRSLYRLSADAVEDAFDGADAPLDVVTLPPSAGHLGTSAKLISATRAPDGGLWIPSDRGVTRVDPVRYAQSYAEAAPVVIETIQTEGQPAAPVTNGLRLPAGARSFTVHYTATDLRSPDLVRFRTFLEGYDTEWVDRGSDRQASYSGVSPGTYTLRVQAMNGGGVWSEATSPAFSVPPRPWETWWAAALGVLLLAGLVRAGYRLRLRTLVQRERELSETVADRTRELQAEKETVAAQAQALRSLDEAKSRVFANISHEFRTPLTLILGPLEDLQEELAEGRVGPRAPRQIDSAIRNGRRLLRLVNQLLDVSRLEAGRIGLQAREVDIVPVVGSLAQAFAPFAEGKGIRFEVEAPPGPVRVWVDPEQIEKVMTNLLGNAFKFTPEGGTVRLGVATETAGLARGAEGTGYLVLTVADDGPGIAPEHLPHVFERFYQADASSTRRQPGTGIGLALAKNLVTLHRGEIVVASEVGAGSTFTVRLPLGRAHLRDEEIADGAPPHAGLGDARAAGDSLPTPLLDEIRLTPTAAFAPPAPQDGPATTVLIVDDNPEIRAYVRGHLDTRYRVVEAENGRDALDAIRASLPDLVVSDVMMPELDGFGLCRAIREDPDLAFLPVVLLTARASIDSKLEGLQLGADDYLTKPFDVRELEVRVENLIASRQRLKAQVAARPPGASHAPPEADAPDPFVAEVRAVIAARLSEDDFGVDALAAALGLGRTTLYRRLADAGAGSPMDMVWTMRLEAAAEMLRGQTGSVSEVAYGVGFKSVAHFCTRFAAVHETSPAAYAARFEA